MDLQRLRDENAIRRVLVTYQRGQDRGHGETIASIYFDDALDFHGGTGFARGVEYAAHTERRLAAEPELFGMHLVGQTTYAFDDSGDAAHTETYVRASRVDHRDGEDLLQLFFGRYLDRFERRAGEWRIARRVTVRDHTCRFPVEPMMPERAYQGVRSPGDVSFAHLRFETV